MRLSDIVVSLIRTVVPVVVGAITGTGAAEAAGVTSDQLTTAITVVFTIGYYLLVRLLEAKWPKAGALLGYTVKPTYIGGTDGHRTV